MKISKRKTNLKFTSDEDAVIKKLLADGFMPAAIAKKLMRGFGRSKFSILSRIYLLRLSTEKLQERAAVARARRSKNRLGQKESRVVCHVEIPSSVLIDRERRSLAPRTITALLFGDPPPGYSALDRRQATGDKNG